MFCFAFLTFQWAPESKFETFVNSSVCLPAGYEVTFNFHALKGTKTTVIIWILIQPYTLNRTLPQPLISIIIFISCEGIIKCDDTLIQQEICACFIPGMQIIGSEFFLVPKREWADAMSGRSSRRRKSDDGLLEACVWSAAVWLRRNTLLMNDNCVLLLVTYNLEQQKKIPTIISVSVFYSIVIVVSRPISCWSFSRSPLPWASSGLTPPESQQWASPSTGWQTRHDVLDDAV